MKKTLVKGLAFAAMGALFMTGNAMAISYHFEDIVNYFPGHANGTPDDNIDSIGTPQVESMDVVINDATMALERINISVTDRRVFDTLFINANWESGEAWDAWDYMARSNSGGEDGGYTTYQNWDSWLSTDGLYQVNDPDNYSYTIVPSAYSGGRENHPNGIQESDLAYVGDASFISYNGTDTLTYDFTALGTTITMGSQFAVGYAPWCANDVMTSPVPEPATMLLLGSGLVGLAGFSRRRARKA